MLNVFIPLLPLADFITAYQTSNLVSGKLIVLILVVFSIVAWSVMITKSKELKAAQEASRRFQAAFRNETHPLALYLKRQAYPESPLFKIYEAGCIAIGGARLEGHRLNQLQVEVVRRATERSVADEALTLESRMGFLATAVSASPMLGLLGTVWGVLDSFAAMAVVGSANLSAVAPGISGALLTTVVGLLVAIPSAIGYNMLTSKIRQIAVQMDNFAQEFVADLQRTFVQQ
ncbi:MAG: Biopolymer transport protein ExbB [Verrucomicrobia bacterium ADurb.Bin345]|nr:MAG: Biopolymer transport protein ExbB [Verrucomicrobia bacterium ADurb.Bin345]